eukprot:Opistho-2@79723
MAAPGGRLPSADSAICKRSPVTSVCRVSASAIRRLNDSTAACRARLRKSAPVNPSVSATSSSTSTLSAHTGIVVAPPRSAALRREERMCLRADASGGGTKSARSKRPALSSALSMACGALVAPSTTTPGQTSRASISTMSCVTRVRLTPPPPGPPRLPNSACTSSMNTTDGRECRAAANVSRSIRSDSPTSDRRRSGIARAKKDAPLSHATTRARSVFPVPGGPYSSTPFGGDMPIRESAAACRCVHVTACSSAAFTSVSPATSPQPVTVWFSVSPAGRRSLSRHAWKSSLDAMQLPMLSSGTPS